MVSDRSNGINWSVIAALAGLACLISVFGLGIYLGTLNYPDEKRHQEYRYTDKDITDTKIAARPDLPEPKEYKAPCDKPYGKDESDLCAQWRAAKAAENSAFWAKWGVWIAVIGSSLLMWQIMLTREAVKDTGDATKAMREANMIAERAQRPWLAIEVTPKLIELTENGYAFYLDIVANNVGQSAAKNYQIACYIFRVPQSIEEDFESRTDRIYQFWRDSFSEDGVMPRVLVPTQRDQFEYYEIGLSGKDVFRQSINGSRFVGVDVAICCQYISTLSGAIHRYEAAYSLHRVRENGDVVGIRESEIPISAADMVARATFYGLVD